MREPAKASLCLWAVIVSCGLDEEFEYDWLGRVRHKHSNRYLRIDATPEFVHALSTARDALALASKGATGALAKARDAVRRRLLAARTAT